MKTTLRAVTRKQVCMVLILGVPEVKTVLAPSLETHQNGTKREI